MALRHGRANDMLPAVLWAGLLAALVAAAMAPDLSMTVRDVTLSAFMGAGLITGGMILFTAGSRTVPSAELALLTLTEVVLGPALGLARLCRGAAARDLFRRRPGAGGHRRPGAHRHAPPHPAVRRRVRR